MPTVDEILANPDEHSETLVKVAQWVRGDGAETIKDAYDEERERQVSVPDGDGGAA